MSVSSIAFMSLWPIASILGAFLVKNDDEVTCSVSFGLILACLFCSVAFGLINALILRLMVRCCANQYNESVEETIKDEKAVFNGVLFPSKLGN